MTPQEIKYLKIAGGVAVAGVVIYFIVKKKPDNGGGVEDPTGNGTSSGNGVVVFNAAKVATELHNAMKDLGTDEDAIFATLTNVSQTQFGLVVKAFGNRTYNTYLGTNNGFTAYPLKTWLFEELSDNDYKTLKLKYPNYL